MFSSWIWFSSGLVFKLSLVLKRFCCQASSVFKAAKTGCRTTAGLVFACLMFCSMHFLVTVSCFMCLDSAWCSGPALRDTQHTFCSSLPSQLILPNILFISIESFECNSLTFSQKLKPFLLLIISQIYDFCNFFLAVHSLLTQV